MKGKKIIIISIIINILTIGVIYSFIKKDYLNNEKIIVKAMTEGEYENNITALNQSHTDYANYIEESKKKIASAITEKGVETSNEDTLEKMVNNIKKISVKSNIKYIDVVLDGTDNYTFNASTISETAEIVGAGIVSRDYSGWMGIKVEYTSSTVTVSNNVTFSDNCTLRIWYTDTIFKMGGIIKWELPTVTAGGNYTFTIPETGEFTLYIISGKGWGCQDLSINSTTIESYAILSEYHSENTVDGHAYMILNINAEIGDTITFSHGTSSGYNTVPFYALTYR